jgi:hypothetical protein
MAVTITLYNHTARLFAEGSNIAADSYKLKLYSSATFNAANTTLAGITGTESTTGTGYTAGGKALTTVAITTVTTNDAMFDADDVIWTASGGSITASYAVLYNATDANSPPLAFIDFGGSQSAGDTTDFKVVWNVAGIFSFTVA